MSELAEFIRANASADVGALRLKYAGKSVAGLPSSVAIDQIECRRKTQRKLPWFNAHPDFFYPSVLAAEQATNQYVAAYHASLVRKREHVLDMTAGLGIDAFTLALTGHSVTAAELDAVRASALRRNSEVLGLDLRIMEGDSIAWLSDREQKDYKPDCIFIDPARRDENAGRVFRLSECQPDITAHAGLLLSHADRVIVKCSPLLDIEQALTELPAISAIDIVCVHGECKEVLLTLQKTSIESKFSDIPSVSNTSKKSDCSNTLNTSGANPRIKVIDIRETDFPVFREKSEISTVTLDYTDLDILPEIAEEEDFAVGNYIYEPSAGVRKLHCGGYLCRRYEGLRQFSPNTVLYVSAERIPDFPGRTFQIESRINGRELKKLKGKKVGIISRNHTLSAADLRKKYGLKEGETSYLIAARITQKETPAIFSGTKEI